MFNETFRFWFSPILCLFEAMIRRKSYCMSFIYTGSFATYAPHLWIIYRSYCFILDHKKGHRIRIICDKSYDPNMMHIWFTSNHKIPLLYDSHIRVLFVGIIFIRESYERGTICKSYKTVFLIFIRRKIYAYAHRKSGIPALDEIEQYLEVCRYIYNIMLFC